MCLLEIRFQGFLSFWASSFYFRVFDVKFAAGLTKQLSTCPEMYFDGIIIFSMKKIEFIVHFRSLNKNFSDFWWKQFSKFVESALDVSRGRFCRKSCFSNKIHSYDHFRCLGQNYSEFWPKFFSRVVKTAFYLCRRMF